METLFGPIKAMVQQEAASYIQHGLAFQQTNQSAVNPSNILKVEIPEEDINMHSFDLNFTVIHFIAIITYINENQISFPGIANFKIDKGQFPDEIDEFTSTYSINTRNPMIL